MTTRTNTKTEASSEPRRREARWSATTTTTTGCSGRGATEPQALSSSNADRSASQLTSASNADSSASQLIRTNLCPGTRAGSTSPRSVLQAPRSSWGPRTTKGLEIALEASVSKYARQRPTLPQGCPCSTIGARELNFRVRNGNGCGPSAIIARQLVFGGRLAATT